MKVFLIEVVKSDGNKEFMPVNAQNKSEAYISTYLELPICDIITCIYEVA